MSRLVEKLIAFGQSLYRNERSYQDYVECINAIWHKREDFRNRLSGAWLLASRWKSREPTTHRAPVTPDIGRALFVWGIACRNFRFSVFVLVCFYGGLRPGEALELQFRDLKFIENVLFLVIRDPKSEALAATQSVTVHDPSAVAFVKRFYVSQKYLGYDQSIIFSEYRLRSVWRQVSSDLDLPKIITPQSLRAGCATAMRRLGCTSDVIRLRLRHADVNTLNSYVQELAEAELSLTPSSAVLRFSQRFDTIIEFYSTRPYEVWH